MTSLHVICDLGPPNQKSWLRPCPGPRLLIFDFKIFLSNKKYLFLKIYDDVTLQVICGLELPNQKSWLRPCQNSRNFYVWLFSFQPIKKQCCPRAEDRTFSRTCRVRGQGRGLELRGQGLQNLSSRTDVESTTQGSRPRPKTQKKIRGQGQRQGQPF